MSKTKTAAKTAKTAKTDAQKELEASAERTAALSKADTDFTAAVAKAAEVRNAAYAKFPDAGNYAEVAWNATMADTDPLYRDTATTFRQKLDTAVDAIKTTGTAGIAGLEDFEVEVKRLLAESDQPIAGILPANRPDATAGRPAEPVRSAVVHNTPNKKGK